MGEGGTIGAPAAIANAISDALSPLDINVSILPMTPERLFRLLEPARMKTKGNQNMNNLAGRVALVTGGGRDVGAAISQALAEAGAAVAVNYHIRRKGEADAVVAKIQKAGGKAKAYQADIANFEAVKAMVASVKADFGGLDILVNNAGLVLRKRFSRDDAGRLAQADRYLPLWRDPLLPRRRSLAGGLGPGPDHFHHGRFLPHRRIRPRDRSGGPRRHHCADEIAGARNGHEPGRRPIRSRSA